MKENMHICFIVPGYPTKDEPVFTFVRQLISAIADLGVRCSVIAPNSISKNIIRNTSKRDKYWHDITEKGNIIDVYQPNTVSVSNLKIFGSHISSHLNQLSVINAFRKYQLKPDILYGHFWDNGLTATIIGSKIDKPVFVATGESEINVHNRFSKKLLRKYLKYVTGVIAVSTKNKNESLELNLSSEEIMEVIPNAIDNKLFYSVDKLKAREELGFNKDDFIVAFTGSFIHRKGIARLSKAMKDLKDVKAIYIGAGEITPLRENALHIGKLPHDEIPLYLNAADVFALPTLAEGASNAILEAMACGLPIISSEGSFNDDILFSDNSIRVNPMDIEAIRDAIVLLKNNSKLRDNMSKSSLKHAESFKIEDRAKKIVSFMRMNINLYDRGIK